MMSKARQSTTHHPAPCAPRAHFDASRVQAREEKAFIASKHVHHPDSNEDFEQRVDNCRLTHLWIPTNVNSLYGFKGKARNGHDTNVQMALGSRRLCEHTLSATIITKATLEVKIPNHNTRAVHSTPFTFNRVSIYIQRNHQVDKQDTNQNRAV